MNDHGILMSDPMIRAYKARLKTMTRRVIKPQPNGHHWESVRGYELKIDYMETSEGYRFRFSHKLMGQEDGVQWLKCPYGQPGDQLWFKETWRRAIETLADGIEYRADNILIWYHYNDDESKEAYEFLKNSKLPRDGKWRSSMFMPRRFARFTPKIIDIRTERLHEITTEDIYKEGIRTNLREHDACVDILEQWIEFWNSINAKPRPVYTNKIITSYVSYPWEDINETREHRGLPWEVIGNPFVWVLEFERYKE